MKILGIDYGSKRIGLSLSDDNRTLAFPHKIILNNTDAIDEIVRIITTNGIKDVVIGESKDGKMKDNSIMEEVGGFEAKLQTRIPDIKLHRQLEFFTSFEARLLDGKKEVDDRAAAIMLQRYLDKLARQ